MLTVLFFHEICLFTVVAHWIEFFSMTPSWFNTNNSDSINVYMKLEYFAPLGITLHLLLLIALFTHCLIHPVKGDPIKGLQTLLFALLTANDL